jgi:hypothetical protein
VITFDIVSPMQAWRQGDYLVDPFICVNVMDQTGPLVESAHLMTDGEIETFFNRAIFELKILPKNAAQSREIAKHELAQQQGRIRGHG